jgi:DNA helicase II / ATP-dependent DNA helicase PcrA
LQGINAEQKIAIESINGPLLIVAGAGTGKTRVITMRIHQMLRSDVDSSNVLALTFTNKAAREMKERLQALVAPNRVSCSISTFHSFCLNLLRKSPRRYGLAPGFSLIGTGDQIDVVRKSLDAHGWANFIKPFDALRLVSDYKNAQLPDSLRQIIPKVLHPKPADSMTVQLAEAYDFLLGVNHAIDFDDCILRVVEQMNKDEDLRRDLAKQFQYIMVDEYQDTNFLQLSLVYQLSQDHRNICVVGDDDQSIYSWRGAVAENINLFERLFPEVTLVKLEQNYRCSSNILSAANSVIKNNASRKDKELWCRLEVPHKIAISAHDNAGDEALWVSQKIMASRGRGTDYKDMAVLYRSNILSKAIEVALRSARIPYKVYGGQSLFEKKEVRDFIAYIRLIGNTRDRLALWRIINVPNRGIGLKSIEQIDNKSKEQSQEPYDLMLSQREVLSSSVQKSVSGFCDEVEHVRSLPDNTPENLIAIGKAVIRRFELGRELRSRTKDNNRLQAKISLLNSLPKWLGDLGEQCLGDGLVCSLQNVLEHLTLDANPVHKKDEPQDVVSVMTIHASKGLEFGEVYLVGVEEGILPHKSSVAEGRTEEERRLFYVAITRAKLKLSVSYARTRNQVMADGSNRPSMFLKEIPEELLDYNSDKPDAQQSKDLKKQTLSRLQSFKNSLRSNKA